MVDSRIRIIQFDIYYHFLRHQVRMFLGYNIRWMIHTKIKSLFFSMNFEGADLTGVFCSVVVFSQILYLTNSSNETSDISRIRSAAHSRILKIESLLIKEFDEGQELTLFHSIFQQFFQGVQKIDSENDELIEPNPVVV